MPEEKIQIKTPEFVSLEFKLAGLGSRAIAVIIDQLILGIVNILLFLFAFFVLNASLSNPGWVLGAVIIAIFLLSWGYFFILEYFLNGKTVGKRVVGIRVIQENGHSITLLSAFIRNLLRIIDMLPASYVLGIILIFFTSKHKRLGDMAAGTIVIHERKTKQKKTTNLEKEINRRGISEDYITMNEFEMTHLGAKEYNLLKTYSYKLLEMNDSNRQQLTKDMAAILLPKVGLESLGKTDEELENELLTLYVKMKKDWEYEL